MVDGNICNGSGACVVAKKDCAPYVCATDGKACLASCTTALDCKDASYRCASGVCIPRSKNGDACASADECASKNCIDGVCCNNACDGQCQACNVAGSEGTCTAVKGDPVAPRAACSGAGTACAGSCDGVGSTCSYPSIGTDCGSTCADGKYVEQKCDNKGTCAKKDPVSCGGYACSDMGCKSACSSPSDCSSGFTCDGGKCVPNDTTCADDGIHIMQGGTIAADCTPRRCKGGKCIEVCATSDECAPGFVCGSGICTAAVPPPSDSGCGCTQAGRDSGIASYALAALALCALTFRSSLRVRTRRTDLHR